jgi:GxxExxY protein
MDLAVSDVTTIEQVRDDRKSLTQAIIGAAIEVHRFLGPGLLESIYEDALCIELEERGIPFERQAKISLGYKGREIGSGRVDLLVNRAVVELKAVDAFSPVFTAQVLSYLRLTGCRVGLLINFNVPVLHEGIKQFSL